MFPFKSLSRGGAEGGPRVSGAWRANAESRPPEGASAVRGRDLGEPTWLARAPDEEVLGEGGEDHRDEEGTAAGAPPG